MTKGEEERKKEGRRGNKGCIVHFKVNQKEKSLTQNIIKMNTDSICTSALELRPFQMY